MALLVAFTAACSPSETASPPTRERGPTGSDGLASAPAPGPASPSPAISTPSAGGTYLALGDSLAVGVGASSPDGLGYVGRLASALEPAFLRNLAVSGETSGSMIEGGQLAEGVALIRAADPPVSLVTLDIGGNDLLRLLASEPCASAPDGASCQSVLRTTLDAFEANAQRILGELQSALAASAPEAPLVVMTYFNPFSGTDAIYERAGELALLGGDGEVDCAAATLDAALRGMNDVIACTATAAGALVADVHPRFRDLGLELTHIGAEDIHANDAGYEVIAEEFLRALASASAG